jgi:hypothetical protein
VTAVQSRSLSLEKTASPDSEKSVGEKIAYRYLVTNTGKVRLAEKGTAADSE